MPLTHPRGPQLALRNRKAAFGKPGPCSANSLVLAHPVLGTVEAMRSTHLCCRLPDSLGTYQPCSVAMMTDLTPAISQFQVDQLPAAASPSGNAICPVARPAQVATLAATSLATSITETIEQPDFGRLLWYDYPKSRCLAFENSAAICKPSAASWRHAATPMSTGRQLAGPMYQSHWNYTEKLLAKHSPAAAPPARQPSQVFCFHPRPTLSCRSAGAWSTRCCLGHLQQSR